MSDRLEVHPVTGPVDGVVEVPGSKSITNRALLLAALADGASTIERALYSDDTRYMAVALDRLGVGIDANEDASAYTVHGGAGSLPCYRGDIFVGNAGTAARFLTAALALGHGRFRVDGVMRMRQRPMADLLIALRQLGVDVRSELDNDCLPIVINASGLAGGRVQVRGDVSSQYVSALLMVAPLSRDGVTLDIEGDLVSEPYVEITRRMMAQWGVRIERDGHRFAIPGQRIYRAQTRYPVEPDASSASYFFAAAAVTGGRVRVNGLGKSSVQGDIRFVDVLSQMGCDVTVADDYIEVRGPEQLRGVDVDMGDISDTVMTLAAIAPFAEGPTTIRNIGHIRHKETDRIEALTTELRRVGADVDEREDGLTIRPGGLLQCAEIETYDDHRMAMSFAILGLRSPGITIRDPECVAKTFPGFFRRLRLLAETANSS